MANLSIAGMHTECGGGKVQERVRELEQESLSLSPHHSDQMSQRCVNWNQYYTKCTTGPTNPFNGAISFDNIGLAWVAIFLVISLEGWTDVMYFVQVLFDKIMPQTISY